VGVAEGVGCIQSIMAKPSTARWVEGIRASDQQALVSSGCRASVSSLRIAAPVRAMTCEALCHLSQFNISVRCKAPCGRVADSFKTSPRPN